MVKVYSKAFENKPSWWQPQNGKLFDIYRSYQKIGSCALALVDDQKCPLNERQFFPDSWYLNKMSGRMKSILEITDLEAFSQREQGNCRLCLQALYELSQHRGCGGRMQMFSDFGSASFYESCGFSGGSVGVDGLKYFDPTSQNLVLLFSTSPQQEGYHFIPILDSETYQNTLSRTNKVLFDRMLQKGQRS